MKKLLKYLLCTVIVLVFLAAIGLGLAVTCVDPNVYKEKISSQISAITGHQTSINGTIKWQFLPWPGFKIADLSMSNSAEFDTTKPLLTIHSIAANVYFLPLFAKKIAFGKITINGMRLNLITNANGQHNWSRQEFTLDAISSANNRHEFFKLNTTAIQKIAVTNSSLSYLDYTGANKNNSEHTVINFNNINLNARHIAFNMEFPITLKTAVQYANLAGNFAYSGTISISTTILQPQTALLNSIILKGNVTTGALQFEQFALKKFTGQLIANNNKINLASATATLAQGTIIGALSYDYSAPTPAWQLQQTLQHVEAQSLLHAVKGELNATLQLYTKGNTREEMLQHLSGDINYAITHGQLTNIDVAAMLKWSSDLALQLKHSDLKDMLNIGASVFSGNNMPKFNSNPTPFNQLTGQAVIKNGLLINSKLLLSSDFYTIHGNGQIDFINGTIDYFLKIKALGLDATNGIMQMQQYLDGYFPVIITGQLDTPQPLPDGQAIIRLIAQKIFNQQVVELHNSIQRLGDHAEHFLKNLMQ